MTSSGGQSITDLRGNLQSDGVSSYSYDVNNRLTGRVVEAGFRRDGTLSRGANPGSFTNKPLAPFFDATNKIGAEGAEIFGAKGEVEFTTDCLK